MKGGGFRSVRGWSGVELKEHLVGVLYAALGEIKGAFEEALVGRCMRYEHGSKTTGKSIYFHARLLI